MSTRMEAYNASIDEVANVLRDWNKQLPKSKHVDHIDSKCGTLKTWAAGYYEVYGSSEINFLYVGFGLHIHWSLEGWAVLQPHSFDQAVSAMKHSRAIEYNRKLVNRCPGEGLIVPLQLEEAIDVSAECGRADAAFFELWMMSMKGPRR
jgi:hypothetical protein